MVAEPAAVPGDLGVAREDGASVAHGRKILRRVEREGRRAAKAADSPSVPLGTLRLGTVLEKPEAEARGEVLDCGEIRGLAVQVHWDDPDGSRRGLRPRVDSVDRVEPVGFDEQGLCPGEANRLDRRERRVGRHEDLITRPDAERLQCQPKRGGSRAGQHGVLHVSGACQLGFELAALRAQDVLARIHGGQHRAFELVVDRRARQWNRSGDLIERRRLRRLAGRGRHS